MGDASRESMRRVRQQVPEWTPAQVNEALAQQHEAKPNNQEVVLVDVREKHEWNEGYIPGAIHVPRGCLVFSPEAPTAFLGRGERPHLTGSRKGAEQDQEQVMAETTCIDVGPYLHHKIEAIAAHRSQFPIDPHLLLHTILYELMGQEYFVRVSPSVAVEPEYPALQTA